MARALVGNKKAGYRMPDQTHGRYQFAVFPSKWRANGGWKCYSPP